MLLRAIIQGASGNGKNGLLASAADAGYRVIIASFEIGSEVTRVYTRRPENVIIVPFADEVEFDADAGLKRKAQGLIQFERFLYGGRVTGQSLKEDPPFGVPRDWDGQTILALDTLTSLGECAETRERELNPMMPNYSNAYAAAQTQEAVCELMVSSRVNCHSIVLSHLRLISPKAESTFDKNETPLQKQVKRERAELEETGYYPTAITPGIARNFTRHFPFALLVELNHKARDAEKNPSQRVLRTRPVPGYQIKCPLDVPDKLPIETALTTILGKLG